MATDPTIVDFYQDRYDEAARLSEGLRQLELVRTRDIVRRHLPAGSLRIADIGGGPGVHASWLAADGHDVALVDPVPSHVEQAGRLPTRAGTIAASIGEATALSFDDESFDAVLLLGPLYHLQDAADRDAAWSEAFRVLRPGGLVIAAAISRFASLHDGWARHYIFDPAFAAIVAVDLATGKHHNPEQRPGWFTTAYFHRPAELAAEGDAAAFEQVTVYAVEGLVGLLPGLEERWADPDDRRLILDGLRSVETEPSLVGASPHLLAIGSRPRS